jgi:hypothetical protein
MIMLKTSIISKIFMISKVFKINVVILMDTFLIMKTIMEIMRHYAASRKVAGSIPDEVIGFSINIILPAAVWPCGGLSL